MPLPTFSGEATMRVGADRFHREHRSDDVDDRVERADLVQVHLIDRRAVNRRLGLAQSVEQLLGAILPGPTQGRSVDQPVDVGEGPMHVMVLSLRLVVRGSRFVERSADGRARACDRGRARGRARGPGGRARRGRRTSSLRCRYAVTRSVQTVVGEIARLPSARRTSSSVTPASISAPSTMSPAAPEKQSK